MKGPPQGLTAGVSPTPAAGSKSRRRDDADGVDWSARLRAAQGDEAALLTVAQSATPLDIRITAIEGLADEASLRQVEHHFRTHDRRVHRLAKQRLREAVCRRESRAAASALLDRTGALLVDPQIPMNHVAALDREWASLPSALLDPEQLSRFTELRSRLDDRIRQHGEAERHQRAWLADAKRALAAWEARLPELAEQGSVSELQSLARALEVLRATRPYSAATAELDRALAGALLQKDALLARLAWFENQDPAEPPTTPWDALPPVADKTLQRLLSNRHQQRLHETRPTSTEGVDAVERPAKPARPAAAQALTAEQLAAAEAQIQGAETALEDGRVAELQQHIQALESTIESFGPARLPTDMRSRQLALRAEAARLRGWQSWSGSRAREDLTAEAEDLARQTVAAGETSDEPRAPKLNLRAHAQRIHGLRLHWKELDRMGAAASQALWERFDGALQTAFAPITAQRAAIDENRRRNLAARLALLDALDAQPGPDASGAQAEGGPAWKDLLHMLNTFQLEWRKLGPLEHTVPADDRAGLQQRLRASIDRFEGPLQQARRVAADRRELLITQAQALQTGAGPRLSMTDAMRQLRDLQAQWQWQARQVPLARDDETALWMRFKSATDAFFARRDAEIAAREADFAAAHAARLAVLERLDSVREDAPASRRVLDEIDRDWRQAAELPRPDAEKLERRYREARTAAGERLRADAGERWRAVCGTLASALALQEAAERGAADAAELASRRAALALLPEPWERALHLRRTQVVQSAPLNPVEVDEWLLHLESALDLPATPESMAQRRALKLRALKDAMEGRTASQGRASEPSQRLVALLQQAGLNEAQGLRLHALVEALGRAEPGSWLAGGLRPAATARTA